MYVASQGSMYVASQGSMYVASQAGKMLNLSLIGAVADLSRDLNSTTVTFDPYPTGKILSLSQYYIS